MNYGKAIRHILQFRGIKQKDLVKRTKISQTHISQIMNNHTEPSYAIIQKIAKALRVPPELISLLAIDPQLVPEKYRAAFDDLQTCIDAVANQILKPKQPKL